MKITASILISIILISSSAIAAQKANTSKIALECPTYLDASIVFVINMNNKTATAGTKSNDGTSNSYPVTDVVISDSVFRIRYKSSETIKDQFTIDRVTGEWTQEMFSDSDSYESTDYLKAKKSDGSNLCHKANVKQKTRF